MKTVFAFLVIFAIHIPHALCKNESILIIALPQTVSSELTLSWERRQEILPGALAAAEIINNDSSLLPLKLVMADSGPVTSYDQPYSGNVLEVIANLTWQNRSADIIGIAGLVRPDVLVSLQNFDIQIANLVHFGGTPNLTNVLYMTATTSVLTDSIIAFVSNNINESKIGLITGLHNSYFLSFSNELYTKIANSSQISVSLYVQIGHTYLISDIVDQIVRSNVHVIFLSIHPSVSRNILSEAYKRNLTWPRYIWIVHGCQLDELKVEGAQNFSEGILTFQLIPNEQLAQTKLCWNYHTEPTSHNLHMKVNPFSYLLYYAVKFFSTPVVNNISTNNRECSDNVYFYQILEGTPTAVGIYDGRLRVMITGNESFSYKNIQLPVALKEFPLPYLVVLPLLSLITTTVLLILYIRFYNEPSVKSTSVSLSLLIFLGCYLMAAYTITLIVDESQSLKPDLSLDFCMVHIWLSGIGLSMPLILATLLVKMLRVYHIISLRRIMKRSVYNSNVAHFVYTFLILLPTITILVLWNAVDPYHNDLRYVEHPGFIKVEEKCVCNHLAIWSGTLLIYTVLLSVVVIIVAIKSRKIRLKQFKDTKKVNLLIFLILFIGVSTYGYWSIFTLSDLYGDMPSYILIAGHLTMSLLCQIILFVPKIWPPLHQKHQHYLSKLYSSNTQDTVTTGLSK